jgi:hypothetical protein
MLGDERSIEKEEKKNRRRREDEREKIRDRR